MKPDSFVEALQSRMDKINYQKLYAIKNPKVHQLIFDSAQLCEPETIFICMPTEIG